MPPLVARAIPTIPVFEQTKHRLLAKVFCFLLRCKARAKLRVRRSWNLNVIWKLHCQLYLNLIRTIMTIIACALMDQLPDVPKISQFLLLTYVWARTADTDIYMTPNVSQLPAVYKFFYTLQNSVRGL